MPNAATLPRISFYLIKNLLSDVTFSENFRNMPFNQLQYPTEPTRYAQLSFIHGRRTFKLIKILIYQINFYDMSINIRTRLCLLNIFMNSRVDYSIFNTLIKEYLYNKRLHNGIHSKPC